MSDPQGNAPVRNGIVEVFEPDVVEGWVEVVPGAEDLPVCLWINDVPVQTTWAVPQRLRHSNQEIRHFRVAVTDFWDFTAKGDRISVRVNDEPLPIADRGMFWPTDHIGAESLSSFLDQVKQGYVFDQLGRFRLSKSKDLRWQRVVMGLFNQVDDVLQDTFSYRPFFCYGTLLGAVREDGFIGHDLDFDCAYVSRQADPEAVKQELVDIAFALIDAGIRVIARPTSLTLTHPTDPDTSVELFHTYVDRSGTMVFPFGVVSGERFTRSDLGQVEEVEFLNATALVPSNAVGLVEHIYGDSWRITNPGFVWERERRSAPTQGNLTPEQIEEIYWADFYAHTEYTKGSSFCEFIKERDDLPDVVVDIGCGDGRDSFAFAAAGQKVVGVDRSHIGVRQATRKAEQLGYGDLRFIACDVNDSEALLSILVAARQGNAGAPILIYTRFFLHSIPEETQERLMATLCAATKSGDAFVAEFRTDKDAAREKIHGGHFRRYQNGPEFGRALQERFGFEPFVVQEGTGFSPYRGEDPELYRVVACKV